MGRLQYSKRSSILQMVIWVLNLVISGMPSILILEEDGSLSDGCFKPCYKWNAFNTK